MNKKVMCDLLDKAHDGNGILTILDALCDGLDETDQTEDIIEEPTEEDLDQTAMDEFMNLDEIPEETLVEATPPRKKSKKELVEV